MGGGLRRRGAALFIVVVLMVILGVLVKALAWLAASGSFRAMDECDRLGVLYVGDAAIAHALTELEADLAWEAGFAREKLSDVDGTYSVTFDPLKPDGSVNNLEGPEPRDGPRGPVPPYTADLVVLAEYRGRSARFEVRLSRQAGEVPPNPLNASGRIRMRGDVRIDGVESLRQGAPVEAGIHSNEPTDQPAIVQWEPIRSTDRAVVSGAVTCTSPNPQAIQFAPGATLGSSQTAAASRPLPDVDVLGRIAAETSQPPPPPGSLTGGGLAPGEYYQAGNLNLNGDLVLNGGTLYIQGSLHINGTIRGRGALFVAGDTRFQGDSSVVTNNEQGVALFSKGSVQLSGFDGTEYLQSLAATEPDVADWMADVDTALDELQSLVASRPPEDLVNGGSAYTTVESLRRTLGQASGAPFPGTELDALGQLSDAVAAGPPGPTRDHMVRRLRALRDFCDRAVDYGGYDSVMDGYRAGGSSVGLFDAVTDTGSLDLLPDVLNLVNLTSLDRLGTSYFQGFVYTNGYLYASHEVDLVGAVVVSDDGTQADGSPDPGNPTLRVEPGDTYLNAGARVTLDKEYFRAAQLAAASAPRVTAWRER